MNYNHNTHGYFVRKPAFQIGIMGLVLLASFAINRGHKSMQGKTFENNIPTDEMWVWYDKHCARQGENQDIVMKDHSVNIPHMMGKFDKRDEIETNPFYLKKTN